MSLKMFTNGYDRVIAESVKQAIKIWEEETGEQVEANIWAPGGDEWHQVDPTESLTFNCEVSDYDRDDYPREAWLSSVIAIKATIHEWIKHAKEPGFWEPNEY